MADFALNPFINTVRLGTNVSGTNTTFALDSAMVFGTSGDAISYDYTARESAALTDFYFFVSAVTGTLGNIQCTIQVRNDTGGAAGSTVHATTTCAVNGATTWARATFGTPYTFVAGTKYHIVISNSSGAPTTDYPTIARVTSRYPVVDTNDMTSRQSTNGGTSWTGGTVGLFIGVLKFTGIPSTGNPYTSANVNYTNNSRQRGFYIAARPVSLGLFELRPNSGAISGINGGNLYLSTSAPGATPGTGEEAGVWLSTGSVKFSQSAVLAAASAYRLVYTFSGNSVNPQFYRIDDYARYADVQAAALGGGTIYATIDNGSGGWTDSTDTAPIGEIWLRLMGATASGGGMISNPGTSGRIV